MTPTALAQTEEQFQQALLEALRLHGWLVAHFRPARTNQGWRTPVEADGKGFPDLICLRRGRMIVAELKRHGRQPTTDQERWIAAFEMLVSEIDGSLDEEYADQRRLLKEEPVGVEMHVWEPADWPKIERVIR